jgi:hypothetical protein
MPRAADLPPHLRPHDEQRRPPHAELPVELTLPLPEIRDTPDDRDAPPPPAEPFLRRD